jgi:ATP-binding cassette subfamily B protein
MVLGYHGRRVGLQEVREVLLPNRDGINARSILEAALFFGMKGRGVRCDLDELFRLERGAILHWEFRHFVVFDELLRDGVAIVDPGYGRRKVSMEEFGKAFTGVALLLEPNAAFQVGESSGVGWRRYLGPLLENASDGWRTFVLSILLQLLALGLPVLTGFVVDRVVPREDARSLTLVAGAVALVAAFHLVSSLVRGHLLLELRTLLEVRMTTSFVQHLVALPYAFFQQRPAGDLLSRLASNKAIRDVLTSTALSSLLDGTLVITYLLILVVASPRVAAVAVGLAAGQLFVFLLQRRRQADLLGRGLEVQARERSFEVEMISGMETLKSMGAEHRAVEHWSQIFVDAVNLELERGRLENLSEAALSTLRLVSPLVALAVATGLSLSGQLSLGAMLSVSALAAAFLAPVGSLMASAAHLQIVSSYATRIEDVFQAEPEPSGARTRPPEDLGRIRVEDVGFRFGPVSPWAVRGVSLAVEPGSFVAVVGRTGCGKSTLASLLVGMHRPTEGRIAFGGVDLRELDLRMVRQRLGIVTQRPYLFAASIRANIALGNPDLPLEAVREAARLAQIDAEIEAMPMGYETPLVDGGSSLSGGQRQRIALARALACKPAVLVLDEATSALDPITENAVHGAISALGCTRVVIAHRLSTIVDADLVLVMEGGEIVERGRHEELLGRKGLYWRYVLAQHGEGGAEPRRAQCVGGEGMT